MSLLPKHLREAVDLLDTGVGDDSKTSPKIPRLPKLIATKPTDDIKITITDANKKIYVDEEGNIFEIE